MSQCKIYLENYGGVYYPGAEIRGRVECYFNDSVTARGIKVRLRCKEHNSWTGTETYTDPSDNKTKTRSVTLTGDKTVLYAEQMLFGSDSGSRDLNPGRHVYPFSFILPLDIPSTFNGPYGSITYRVKAIVDRPLRSDYEDYFIFVVQSPIDFNKMSHDLQDITTYSDEKSVCCWCCHGGNITMDVELPKIAFVPGETIPFKIKITNLSNSNVENLKAKLVKTITYKVTSPHHESKDDVDNILTLNEHGVGAHGEYTYNLQLAIPGYLDVPNFTKCELFSVKYELKVTAAMPTCTLDLDISAWDIQIGHVQRVNYGQGDPGNKVPGETGLNIDYPDPNNQQYPPPAGGAYPPPSGGVYPPPAGGAYPPPSGGAYPPPAGGAYPPPAGGGYPGGFVPPPTTGPPPNMPYPPPQYSAGSTSPGQPGAPPAFGYPVYPPAPEKQGFSPGPPSAPSSSIASAPADSSSKGQEAAASAQPLVPNTQPELPPPSYNQVQQNANLPYPPQ